MVATTMPPAFSTPSQEANSIALLGPRRKHAVAGDEALSLDQQARDPVGEVLHLAIGPARRHR